MNRVSRQMSIRQLRRTGERRRKPLRSRAREADLFKAVRDRFSGSHETQPIQLALPATAMPRRQAPPNPLTAQTKFLAGAPMDPLAPFSPEWLERPTTPTPVSEGDPESSAASSGYRHLLRVEHL